jgi:hypothetical protein
MPKLLKIVSNRHTGDHLWDGPLGSQEMEKGPWYGPMEYESVCGVRRASQRAIFALGSTHA